MYLEHSGLVMFTSANSLDRRTRRTFDVGTASRDDGRFRSAVSLLLAFVGIGIGLFPQPLVLKQA